MKRLSCAVALLCASLTPVLVPQEPVPATAEPHPAGWLVGRWVGEGFGGVVEESWLPPLTEGGPMLGTFRAVADGKVVLYELITIEPDTEAGAGGELLMRLKHFHANLASWEPKDECLVWPREPLELDPGERALRFGPALYEAEGDDGLRVTVELEEGPVELVLRRAE